MITKLSHASIYVLDQEDAYDFYVNKLGFKVNTDAQMGPDARWLTLNAPNQPGLEITLIAVKEGMMWNAETASKMKDLVLNGAFGFGVFETKDIYATYEELKAKGVEFSKPPTEEFYAIEAIFKDNSGNWFSLTQKKNETA